MQYTTKNTTMTPERLAHELRMDYPALKRALHRLDISCAKDEMLRHDDLVAIIQQQSEPHHKRADETVAAAKSLATQLGVFHSEEGSDGEGEPAPSATPSNQKAEEKVPAADSPADAPDAKEPVFLSTIPSNAVEPRKAEGDALIPPSPAWRSVAYEVGKTAAVATLISFQAFIFASLTMRVINGEHGSVELQFWFAFIAAFLIESGGVMIVSRYKVPEGASEWTKRDIESSINAWLIPFMIFQMVADCSYIGLFGRHSDMVGQWLVALAIPAGIFVYSHLYFNRN